MSQIVAEFMLAIPTLTPAQITLVQNQLIVETFKRMMGQV